MGLSSAQVSVSWQLAVFATALRTRRRRVDGAGLSRVRLLELEAGGDTVGERALRRSRRKRCGCSRPISPAQPSTSPPSSSTTGLSALDVAIYRELRRIPPRRHRHLHFAARAGAPGAAQAVGGAMARNPWVIVVPVPPGARHRRGLGGFRRRAGYLVGFRLLSRMEGVDLDGGAPMLPGLLPKE